MGKLIPMYNILSGLGNQLFVIFSNPNYDNMEEDTIVCPNMYKHHEPLFARMGIKYKRDTFEGEVGYKGYRQNFKLFNIPKLRKMFIIPQDIKTVIYSSIPDIEERLIIHVRRGDYLFHCNRTMYISPSKSYIEKVYHKYYKGMKVIVISDDKQWCKDNLSDLCEDIIISPFDDVLHDFYCLIFAKAIICSASSFSMFGAYLNPNNDCVVPHPYYKYEKWHNKGEEIIPTWAKREDITEDMK